MSASAVPLLARLGGVVGGAHVALDGDASRIAVRPGSASEIVGLLRIAREERALVTVGDREPLPEPRARPVLRLDLGRLANVQQLDEASLLVLAQAGLRLGALEARLRERGLTLGPLPPATLARTLGAVLAAPRPSEATPRGRLLDRCAAVDAVLADGTDLSTRLAPRKATGPDLMHVLLGTRGATGVLTAAWLRLARRPPHRSFAGFAFPAGPSALATARRLLGRGARPAELVLVDAALVAPPLRTALREGERELLLGLFDGARELADAEESLLAALAGAGGRALPPPLVEGWFQHQAGATGLAERFVPATDLARAWWERRAPSLVRGLHDAGAALLGDAPPTAPAPDAAHEAADRARESLRRRLDPDRLLSDGAR